MVTTGAEVVVDPRLTVAVLGWAAAGVILGTVSGLIPGLHANNFALVLAGIATALPGPPLLVGVAMLAAGVVHTFVNVVPAMALGVPDAEMALTALPGHRLILDGRGHEAIRLSAVGSLLAIVLAVALAIPVTVAVTRAYPTIMAHLSLILALVVCGLIASERTTRRRVGATLSFALAATLGAVTLDVSPSAPLDAGGMLAPLFAGLFGAPVLIDAMRGGGVPPQEDDRIRLPRGILAVAAIAGALAGAVVGYLPGISAAIAAVAVLFVMPDGDAGADGIGDRRYVVATSGVDTANTVFALFALVAIGQPRTGVMVAFESAGVPQSLPILLGTVVFAGVAGFFLVIGLGDRYLAFVGNCSYWKISVSVLVLLCGLSYLFAGLLGVCVLVVATAIGLVPVRFRARRVHLMGVLIGPLLFGI